MPVARRSYSAYASAGRRGTRARSGLSRTYTRRVSAPARYRPRVSLPARRSYSRPRPVVRRRRLRR